MAATAPHKHKPRQGQANAAQQVDPAGWECVFSSLCCVLVIALVITATVLLCGLIDRRYPSEDPVYSVSVAAVAGLDPARDLSAAGRPTLSPVLNLTVHINNSRNSYTSACVFDRSAATVAYGDAVLGRGSVPDFCAGTRRESERVARVWALDVVVPRFLRDQLAAELAVGEAEVDVEVLMPGGCSAILCIDHLLACTAKIGGGLSRCWLSEVRQRSTGPEARSTI